MDERARFQRAAGWLLRHESGGCADAASPAPAAAGAIRRFGEGFAVLVGPLEVRALAARALQMAHARYVFLRTVRIGPSPGGALEGLADSLVGVDPAEACAGLASDRHRPGPARRHGRRRHHRARGAARLAGDACGRVAPRGGGH